MSMGMDAGREELFIMAQTMDMRISHVLARTLLADRRER